LKQKGYANMKVLKEGIPGWVQKRYPMEGARVGQIEHRPYPREVRDLERRLDAQARGVPGARVD